LQYVKTMKYRRIKKICAFLSMACLLLPVLAGAADSLPEGASISEKLQQRLNVAGDSGKIVCRKTLTCESQSLRYFYMKRGFVPAWSREGIPLADAEAMLKVIRNAYLQGLQPQDYHLSEIEASLAELRQNTRQNEASFTEKIINLDLLLTDAFLLYGSHMLEGRVDPNRLYPATWVAIQRSADMADALEVALNTHRVDTTLYRFEPQYVGYERLRQALVQYRTIAAKGGWPTIPGGNQIYLKKGSHNRLVALLWLRLMLSGDLDITKSSDGGRFDTTLEEAVITFQKRHGLKADGIVRKETVRALNVPVENRIRQIEMNLERWRWYPQDLGTRYILVNIPDYSLEVVNNNRVAMDMRVIVGRRTIRNKVDPHTPVFSGRMTHLEINPYWNVPYSIATKELLPEIKKDPLYLSKKNMFLFSGKGKVDPATVDWTKIHEKNFKYQIRQDPGAFNALSRIKFLFPNRFDVYLHDTPTRNLFKRTERDFSHGCMRIEKPVDLAVFLLNDPAEWSEDKVKAAIRKGKNLPVYLPEPIDVHVQYWTTWVDSDGIVQFRDDVYGYDPILELALKERLYRIVPGGKIPKPVMTTIPSLTANY
jgi:murein L,D-transpeptidase YcbB/YkuD